MKFSEWELYIVGESRLAVSFRFEKQPYIMFISFENSRYQIEGVYHTGVGDCINCYRYSDEKNPSACFSFLVNARDIAQLDKELESYLNQSFASKSLLLALKRNRTEQAKRYLKQMDALLAISVKERDGILFYAADFTYYVASRNQTMYAVDLTGKVSPYKESKGVHPLIVARELFTYMKQNQAKKVEHMEIEIVHKHDVMGKKEAKLPLVMVSLKKTIQLFEAVDEPFQSEMFQQLIAFLNEVLYREIALEYQDQEEFMQLHERISSEVYAYAIDDITYEECVNRILINPDKEMDNRKERVIFTIKAVQLMESVFKSLQQEYSAKAYTWFQAVYHKLFNYLRLELGITYETDHAVRKEQDEFLQHALKKFFIGETEEIEAYERINEQLPYIHLTTYERINQMLQTVSKSRQQHVYYLMEIPFHETLEESLRMHDAYLGIEKIHAELVDFNEKATQQQVIRWLGDAEEEFRGLINELLSDNLSKSWVITMSPLRSNEEEVAEYILFDGDRLYRLHWRKNK